MSYHKEEQASNTKDSEEGRGVLGAGAETTLKAILRTMVRQVVPLKLMEDHSGADVHLQPRKDPIAE